MESKIVHIFQEDHKFVRKFVSWYQLKIEFTVMSEPGYRGDRFYQIFLPYLKWENIMPTTLLLPVAFSNLPTALQCRNKTDNCWFIHEYIFIIAIAKCFDPILKGSLSNVVLVFVISSCPSSNFRNSRLNI